MAPITNIGQMHDQNMISWQLLSDRKNLNGQEATRQFKDIQSLSCHHAIKGQPIA
jgi:hypothetical protein